MSINPQNISWVNPIQAKAPDGSAVAWDANTELAGIEIAIDAVPAVSVPVAFGATTFQLASLDAYKQLGSGDHSVKLAVVTKEGVASDFSAAVTFSVAVVPFAPTAVVVA